MFKRNMRSQRRNRRRGPGRLEQAPRRRPQFEPLERRLVLSSIPPGTVFAPDGLPLLHSNDQAPVAIFLDFQYESRDGQMLLFNPSGDPETIDAVEQEMIAHEWAKTSATFAPFEVDVTTVMPDVDVPFIWAAIYRLPGGPGGGGGAVTRGYMTYDQYLNSDRYDPVRGRIEDGLLPQSYIREGAVYTGVITHEVGHSHGVPGHETADEDGNGLGIHNLPIERGPFTRSVGPVGAWYNFTTEWTYQANPNGFFYVVDDFDFLTSAIVTGIVDNVDPSYTGDGLRPDDHLDTIAGATAMSWDAATSSWIGDGIIERENDTDTLSFTWSGGTVWVGAQTALPNPLLDVRITLSDATGNLIAAADPAESMQAAVRIDSLAAGTYYVDVDTDGDYSELGGYRITASTTLPEALEVVAQISMDGNSLIDSSGQNHDGSWIGGAQWTTGPDASSAARLDGSNRIEVYSGGGNFTPSGHSLLGRTFSFWFQADDAGAGGQQILFEDTVAPGYKVYLEGGKLKVYAINDAGLSNWRGGVTLETPGTLNSGQWYHATLTHRTTFSEVQDTIRLYLDGAEVDVGPAGPVPFTNRFYIGSTSFTGAIDDVQIYSDVIPSHLIAELADNSGLSQSAPTGTAINASGSTTHDTASLSWDAVGGATGYEVLRSLDNQNFALLATLSAATTTYDDTSLRGSQSYFYRINALGADGVGEVEVLTRAHPVRYTQYTKARNENPDPYWAPKQDIWGHDCQGLYAMMLTFFGPDGHRDTQLRIDQSTDGVNFTPVVTLPANESIYYDNGVAHTGLVHGETYTYRFVPIDDLGPVDSAAVVMPTEPLNFDPDAVDDDLTVDEYVTTVLAVLANDTDWDQDVQTIVGFTQPPNGTVVDNGDGTLGYTPDPGYLGGDAFTYTIDDGFGGSDTATVNLTVVDAPNTPPTVAVPIDDVQVTEQAPSTLKVYLLAGQSNMEGQAYTYDSAATAGWNIPTMEFLLSGTAAATNYLNNMPFEFKNSLDAGWMTARDDVWGVHYYSGNGNLLNVVPTTDPADIVNGIAPLSPGFGVSQSVSMIGPELGMGTRLGDALDSPVFLFKSDKGGTTLAEDWRPPSAVAARGGTVGVNYTNTLNQFTAMLDTLDADLGDDGVLNGFGNATNYEVAGFVWLQGWNEQFNDGEAEYALNIVDLIHDVRSADTRIPDDLGLIIAESSDQHAGLNTQRAAAAAALNGEIPGSAVFIENNNMIGTDWGNNELGVPFSTNWGYHFHARAENFLEIGWRMAGAAIDNGYVGDSDFVGSVVDLTGVFTDLEDDDATLTLTVTGNTNPGLADATINGTDLLITYTPEMLGSADITVRATDSGGLYVEDVFTVTVGTADNAPTVATPIADVTIDENDPDTPVDLTGVFTDVEDDDLTLALTVAGNTNPALVDTSLVGMDLTLSVEGNGFGTADITIRATDSGGNFVDDTFTLTVRDIDNPIVVSPIADVTVDEDASDTVIDLSGVFAAVESTVAPIFHMKLDEATGPNYLEEISGLSVAVEVGDVAEGQPDMTPDGGTSIAFAETVPVSYIDAGTLLSDGTTLVAGSQTGAYLLTDNYTVSTWFNLSTGPLPYGDNAIISSDWDSSTGWLMGLFNDGDALFDFGNVRSRYDMGVQPGQDYFFAVMQDPDGDTNHGWTAGANHRFALYDVAADTWTTADGTNSRNVWLQGLEIGAFNGAREFNGTIDDVRIHNATLAQSDLDALVTASAPLTLTYNVQGNTDPSLLDASIGGDQLTLDYVADAHGTADVTVRATDSGGLFTDDTFTVTVNPVNDDPVAVDDALSTVQDTSILINVATALLGNDSDPIDGDSVSLDSFTQPGNGSLVDNGDGTLTYTPDPGFSGSDAFSYTITDGNGGYDTAAVDVTVNPDPEQPTVVAPIDDVTVDEDAASTVIDLSGVFESFGAAVDPVFHMKLDESAGPSYLERISGLSVAAEMGDLVEGQADLTGLGGTSIRFAIDTPASYIDAGTLQSDGVTLVAGSDPDYVMLSTYTISAWVSLPGTTGGGDRIVISSDWDSSTGWMLGLKDGAIENEIFFDFGSTRYSSGLGLPDGASGLLVVQADPAAPFAGMPSRVGLWDGAAWTWGNNNRHTWVRLQGLELGSFNNGTRQFDGTIDDVRIYDTTLSQADLDALVTGPAPLPLTYTVQGNTNALLVDPTVNGDQLTLDYLADANGTADVTIRATNPGSLYTEDTFTVTVNAVNDDPVAGDDALSTDEDTPLVIDVAADLLINDSDPVEGDTVSLDSFTQPTSGSVVDNGDGTLTYTPDPGYFGSDSFSYTINDGNGGTDSAQVSITVNEVGGTVDDTDLVAHFTFDDGTAADTSPYGNDNSATLVADAVVVTDAERGQVLSLDGTDDFADVPDSTDINLSTVTQRTIALHFKADGVSGRQTLYEEGGGSRGLNIYIDNGQLYVGAWGMSGVSDAYLSTSIAADGQWHHAAVVLDAAGNALIGYLDGTSLGSGSGGSIRKHSGDVGLGRSNGRTQYHDGDSNARNAFSGRIDDVRIYNRSLDATEMGILAGSPLMAAGGEVLDSTVAVLDASELNRIAQASIDCWVGLGIDSSAFDTVSFTIADLEGGRLSLYANETVYVDINAAGHGWFVDETPQNDSELRRNCGPQGMDLLTAVNHELGHRLGLEDIYDGVLDELMDGMLQQGTRFRPGPSEVDSVLALEGVF